MSGIEYNLNIMLRKEYKKIRSAFHAPEIRGLTAFFAMNHPEGI